MLSRDGSWIAIVLAGWVAACGRTPAETPLADAAPDAGGVERCDLSDDDGDGRIDEDFRDAAGRYVDPSHCGACGQTCDAPIANAEAVGCDVVDERPTCVAIACAEGFAVSTSGRCAEIGAHACLPCLEDDDCGTLPGASCRSIGGELRCTYGCEHGCPSGFTCNSENHCIPVGSDCRCDGNERFEAACALSIGDTTCVGRQTCEVGRLGPCEGLGENCNGEDDDCDARIDEDYRDALGSYSLDLAHCGSCGVACDPDANAGLALVCGGDPFAPTCVTACPDLDDGAQVGDMLDADRRIDNGCECVLRALQDDAGPGSLGELDSNCDGADGELLESFYVATDGSDDAPGSPTRPLRSIGVAVERAAASIPTDTPRRHVYVATGTYTESVRVRNGVLLHGGYRRDFLARNPEGFEVVVVAPVDGDLPGGAAMLVEDAGSIATLVEGFRLRGRDADVPGAPAIGLVVVEPGSALVVRDLAVRAGKPGPGSDGGEGMAGASFASAASAGAPQRAAIEDASHACLDLPGNVVEGGAGGTNVCGGVAVSGGDGGSPTCPTFGVASPSGESGLGPVGSAGGEGGLGGLGMRGPIMGGASCPGVGAVCCGLADFEVPTNFPQPEPGADGSDGASGMAGGTCADPLGRFDGVVWTAGLAGPGTSGRAGRGGGGGGAGGGVRMTWVDTSCEWPDGLGGAGGGGGAAGCGGGAGTPGGSGGPSIGVLVVASDASSLPVIEDVTVRTQDGGRGGLGGAGGDGGLGGAGGFGGALPNEARSTPPLAGPLPGQRGGKGGNGGAGGGGGGGCGGSVVGLWLTGLGNSPALGASYQANNTFTLGSAGAGGPGGGGGVPAADGLPGSEIDVLVR